MLINCASDQASFKTDGNPSVSRSDILLDFQPYFDVAMLEECLHDTKLAAQSEPSGEAVPAWNMEHQAVLGWCAWVRLKPEGATFPADVANGQDSTKEPRRSGKRKRRSKASAAGGSTKDEL